MAIILNCPWGPLGCSFPKIKAKLNKKLNKKLNNSRQKPQQAQTVARNTAKAVESAPEQPAVKATAIPVIEAAANAESATVERAIDPQPLTTTEPVTSVAYNPAAQTEDLKEAAVQPHLTPQPRVPADLPVELPAVGDPLAHSDRDFTADDSQLGFSALSETEPQQQSSVSAEIDYVAEPTALDIPDILKTNHLKQAQLDNETVQQVQTESVSVDRQSRNQEPEINLNVTEFNDFADDHSDGITANQQAAIDSPEDVVNNLLQTLARSDKNPIQPQYQTNHQAQSEPTDHAATEEELCRSRDIAPSERDSGPDKFEKLLAERDTFDYNQAETETAPATVPQEPQESAVGTLTADEEIESLKARLKELSPDYLDSEQSSLSSEAEEESTTAQQQSDNYLAASPEMTDGADFSTEVDSRHLEPAVTTALLSAVQSVNVDQAEIAVVQSVNVDHRESAVMHSVNVGQAEIATVQPVNADQPESAAMQPVYVEQAETTAQQQPESISLYADQISQELSSTVVVDDHAHQSELVIGLSEVELQISQDLDDLNDDSQHQPFNQPEPLSADTQSLQVAAPLTTVIDDDVSLEDLDSEVPVRAAEFSANQLGRSFGR